MVAWIPASLADIQSRLLLVRHDTGLRRWRQQRNAPLRNYPDGITSIRRYIAANLLSSPER